MPQSPIANYSLPITPDLSIPKAFVQAAAHYGDKVALREKEYGIWRPLTWREYLAAVQRLTLGLQQLGIQRDDKLVLIGDNRPEGLFAEMATLCVGAAAVWVYQDSLLDEVQYIVNHSDARVMFCEGQEEVDKALSIRAHCPQLKHIIYDDPKGMRNYDDPMLLPLPELMQRGEMVRQQQPQLFDELVAQTKGDDIALLLYTSGTTSAPKGALLTHSNLLRMGKNLLQVDPYYAHEDFVSFLPFAWIGEQMMSLACGLMAGFTINFPEEPETVLSDLREIGPHVMFSAARLYEQMVRTLQVKYTDASFIKRKVYEWGVSVGYQLAGAKFNKQTPSSALKLKGRLADWLVHRPLRDHLGMSRLKNAYIGGSAISPDHFKFFHAIGVNMKQIYGQTEIAGISVVHRSDDVRLDTVGKPIPETEVQITPEGEIISRSPSVFKGYYKMPDETAKTLRDGWLHSGDTGFITEDGHLVFFDRTKDVMRLSDGRKFSPMYIESRLKFSPYIKDTWTIGHQRPFVTAVIAIDYAVVGEWAESHNIAYTTYQELSQEPKVYELVREAIANINKDLPEPARIKRFLNLYKEFDADDDELTRTRKLRRAFLEERYKDIVAALYNPNTDVAHIDTNITYEDGRVVKIKADLKVMNV
jgi:long-chain acyl-CoA synthetase